MSLADKPVYPIAPYSSVAQGLNGIMQRTEPGMTLLQHYAGLAMQGIISNSELLIREMRANAKEPASVYIAKQAVIVAKALIAELEKEQNQ